MRLLRVLFAVVIAAGLFVTPEAQAVGCWVCAHSYDTCIYYAETNLEAWRRGCGQNYTPGTTNYNNCMIQGDVRYTNDLAQCDQEYFDCQDYCETNDGGPRENCPIVIDLENHGVRFTSAEEGVAFDIDADGEPENIAWTDAREGDGFLVWDRNRNGTIDSGRELFGDSAPQAPSDTPNGFLALELLDGKSAGGNGDGVVSAEDRAFGALRVWIDANQNGKSEAGELRTLPSLGITAIDYDYKESARKDRYGNELRYRARVQLHDGSFADAIDVFFRAF